MVSILKTNKLEDIKMKTRNNVQKIALKTSALIATIILLSFGVNAQDLWKDMLAMGQFNELAYACVTNYDLDHIISKAHSNTDFFIVESEDELEVEDWMTKSDCFSPYSFINNVDSENMLEVEDWMINSRCFDINPNIPRFPNELEKRLEVESWMVESKVWNL